MMMVMIVVKDDAIRDDISRKGLYSVFLMGSFSDGRRVVAGIVVIEETLWVLIW